MEEKQEKKIEVCEVAVGDLQDNIGNPRKITARKFKELKESFETFGDFGIIVIDHENNIISGHQRVAAIREEQGDDATVLCKRLVGYTTAELKAINIKANTHAGDWDLNKLAEWTGDLSVKLGLDLPATDASERKINEMEPLRYEKYDYVMIVCRTGMDYENLQKKLGIEDKKVIVGHTKQGKRKIKCRAIWYDDITVDIKKKD